MVLLVAFLEYSDRRHRVGVDQATVDRILEDAPEVVGRRERLGVRLLIVADGAFLFGMLFTYFYLKNNFADLRIAYAGTAHKSQGSTYHTVYIDLSDLRVCRDPQELARLLYVAVSRATTRVVFYGSL